jgi:Flp pilus assembly protein TadG
MKSSFNSISHPRSTLSWFSAHKAKRSEAGQSLIELALVFPLFTLILLGGTEFARYAWASIEVSNAARAGAQYGAQSHITAVDSARIQAAALNDGVNLTGLSATNSQYCVCSTAESTQITCSTGLASCPSPATLLVYVQVNTTASVTPLIRYSSLPSPLTIKGSAVMEVEQ